MTTRRQTTAATRATGHLAGWAAAACVLAASAITAPDAAAQEAPAAPAATAPATETTAGANQKAAAPAPAKPDAAKPDAAKPDAAKQAAAAASIKVERTAAGKKLFRITEGMLVEGQMQKPNAFYVLQRAAITYDWESLDESFLPRIRQATLRPPF